MRILPVIPHAVEAERLIIILGNPVLRPKPALLQKAFAEECVVADERHEEALQGFAGPDIVEQVVDLVAGGIGIVILMQIARVGGALHIGKLPVDREFRQDSLDDLLLHP